MAIKRIEPPSQVIPRQKSMFDQNQRPNPRLHALMQLTLDRMNHRISAEKFEEEIAKFRGTPYRHEHPISMHIKRYPLADKTDGPLADWKAYVLTYSEEECTCPNSILWLRDDEMASIFEGRLALF